MTRITYFVAASLDGHIAGPDGELDWLPPVDPSGGEDYGYRAFYASVDGIVMGRRTYEACRTLGDWPYAGKPCWVMTRQRDLGPLPAHTELASATPSQLHTQWRSLGLQHVFLVGGSEIARAFLDAELLHELVLSTVPVALGGGVPLFAPRAGAGASWRLQRCTGYAGGLTQSSYLLRAAWQIPGIGSMANRPTP